MIRCVQNIIPKINKFYSAKVCPRSHALPKLSKTFQILFQLIGYLCIKVFHEHKSKQDLRQISLFIDIGILCKQAIK